MDYVFNCNLNCKESVFCRRAKVSVWLFASLIVSFVLLLMMISLKEINVSKDTFINLGQMRADTYYALENMCLKRDAFNSV